MGFWWVIQLGDEWGLLLGFQRVSGLDLQLDHWWGRRLEILWWGKHWDVHLPLWGSGWWDQRWETRWGCQLGWGLGLQWEVLLGHWLVPGLGLLMGIEREILWGRWWDLQ